MSFYPVAAAGGAALSNPVTIAQGGTGVTAPPLVLSGATTGIALFEGEVAGDTTARVAITSSNIGLGNGTNGQPTTMTYKGGGGINLAGGSLDIASTGFGLLIKTGSNCKMGSGTLSGGTVTIANTSVTASSIIFLTDTSNGANLGILSVGTIIASTSFVVNSSNALDAGTFNYLIIEPG